MIKGGHLKVTETGIQPGMLKINKKNKINYIIYNMIADYYFLVLNLF